MNIYELIEDLASIDIIEGVRHCVSNNVLSEYIVENLDNSKIKVDVAGYTLITFPVEGEIELYMGVMRIE